MVIDLCYFNGEYDAFEIRYNILKGSVDKFIVCEARETFSGIPKKLTFPVDKYPDVDYYIMSATSDLIELARTSSNVGAGEHYWVREFAQKEDAKNALLYLNDDDLIFVSDCDEVWNPILAKHPFEDKVYKPLQNLTYIYYVNQRTDENWTHFTGTIVTKYKNIKNACLNHLRTHSKNEYTFIENGGWHFNALGGAKNKIDSFKHPVYTEQYMKTREKGARIDESDLPQYLLDNRDRYKHLFHD